MSQKFWLAGAFRAAGACFLSLTAVTLPAADNPNIRVVEEIVAKVNGDIITRGELLKQRQQFREELMSQGVREPQLTRQVDQRAADALREQIDQLLLVQKGKDLTINVESDVNKAIAQIQSEAKIADADKFHDYVREKTGEPFEDFRQQMRNKYLTQRVIGQEVGRGITIPTAELQKYYDAHKADFVRQEMVLLREILVPIPDATPKAAADAEKKARDIVARARKGEKFGELARQYSSAATAQQDGELGYFKPGDLRKEIEDVVFKQSKGYVTEPIRVPNGFEIMRVEDRYAAGQASFDEVKEQIQGRFYEEQMGPKVREYLTQLRKNAFLEIKPGFADSGAAPGKDTAWRDPAQLKPETTTKEEVAARRKRRLLGIIPAGSRSVNTDVKKGSSDPVATPTAVPAAPAAPAPAAPAPGTPLSTPTSGANSATPSAAPNPALNPTPKQ